LRARAIWFSLKYGVLPYESDCHYGREGAGGYFSHLRINLALAWRWATFAESAGDRAFERGVNDGLPLFGDVRLRRSIATILSRCQRPVPAVESKDRPDRVGNPRTR
jgi:hypothetical protein